MELDLKKLTDQELVRKVMDGYNLAYDELCRRYEGALCSMFISRGVYEHDDIVQESLIKAYLNLEKYDPTYSFGQWIFAIAKHLHIDFLRKEKGVKVDIDSVVSMSGNMTPEQSIISSQSRMLIEARLSSLPKGYREIVELRFLDELSYEEIANKLDIPMGTVKTKIHRARILLSKGENEE